VIHYRTAIRSALGRAPAANELLSTFLRAGPSVVLASGSPAVVHLLPRAIANWDDQNFSDGGFLDGRLGQREVRPDLVAVAAAVFLLDDVSGCVRSVTMLWALRSVIPRLAAMSRGRTPGSHSAAGVRNRRNGIRNTWIPAAGSQRTS